MGTVSEWFHQIINQLTPEKHNRGQTAERLAKKYLKRQGLEYVASNHNTPMGEIDLIFKDQDTLVFVEVRYKSSNEWASPAESVTWHKQRKLIKAAQSYVNQHPWAKNMACRFDVVAMQGALESAEITWLPHAFY